MRRVLMTADAVGGVFPYALDLARGFADRGIATVLAMMGPAPSEGQRRDARAIAGLILVESELRLEWMDDPWSDLDRAGRWLLDLEATHAPDLVHLNGYAHAVLPFRAPKVVVAHSDVLSWWSWVKGEAAPPSFRRYAAVVRDGLVAADRSVAISHAVSDDLLRHYGLAADRVIRNGRDPSAFAPAAKERYVFAAGRVWDPAKALGDLARIAPRLSWPVHVAGDPVAKAGEERETAAGLLGRRSPSEVARWMATAAIYALPARYEPFGLSVLEAALSGCALVLGDRPSLRELWDGAAIFVPPGDDDALVAAIEGLAHDDETRTALAERARRRARRYDLAETVAAYVGLYAELLGQERSRRCAS
jgi:glycosyltransferase involved in cell wall biosynthesis